MWKAYTKTLADYVAKNGCRSTVLRGSLATFAMFIETMKPLAATAAPAAAIETQIRDAHSAA
jgi:hypothetical protein